MKNDHPSELNDSTSINRCMMELKNFPKGSSRFQKKRKYVRLLLKKKRALNTYLFCRRVTIPFIRFV